MLTWHEEHIAKSHPRSQFHCGERSIDEFLARYARQEDTMGVAKTFLAIDDANGAIVGFYTLTVESVPVSLMPEDYQKRLGHHNIPFFLLARLGVDRAYQGQGIGGQLLVAAAHRCITVAAEVGGLGLLIDAKSPELAAWYKKFGAVALPSDPLRLFIPLETFSQYM